MEKPTAPALQVMNLYVPQALEDDAKAPVYLFQQTGGMGEAPAPAIGKDYHGIIGRALSEGYVVACPGARGRDTVVDGVYVGRGDLPITDFAHIDIAYEWLFSADRANGLYEGNKKDAAVSRRMAKAFEAYVNRLHLTDPETGEAIGFEGEDTYSPYLLKKLSEAATKYLSELSQEERNAWLADPFNQPVLDWDGEKASVTDLKAYVNWNTGRWMKYLGCYDGFFSRPSRENEAFGESDGSLGHFSLPMGEVLAASPEYAKEGQEWIEEARKNAKGEYLVNPMNFIGTDEVSTIAPHWYMRCGCHHETTGNIFLNLALKVLNCTDADVNWRYSWPMRHTGISDIEQDEAFEYFNRICR